MAKKLKINGKEMNFKLDTGADSNAMSVKTLTTLTKLVRVKLLLSLATR